MARPEDYDTLEDCLNAFDANIIEFNAGNANLGDNLAAVRAAGRKVMFAYMGESRDVLRALLQLSAGSPQRERAFFGAADACSNGSWEQRMTDQGETEETGQFLRCRETGRRVAFGGLADFYRRRQRFR